MGKEIARIAPPMPYYLLIDSTNVFDAGIFGMDMERKFGWRNLLDHLPEVPGDRGRLDPGKALPFLPVYRIKVIEKKAPGKQQAEYQGILGQGVAIVMPAGLNGWGRDTFWKKYNHGGNYAKRQFDGMWTTFGRHTAAEESARFMHVFCQRPLVQVFPAKASSAGPPGQKRVGEIVASDVDLFKYYELPPVFHPEIVFYSSHGYYGGFMRGENILSDNDNAVVPPQARTRYFCKGDPFLLGRAVKETGAGFCGPLWLIMAQCSTLNESTWPDWATLLTKSMPQVRGVLAYDDLSPSSSGTAIVTRKFLNLLAQKNPKSLKDAWIAANGGDQNWAAVVHEDALDDTLANWHALRKKPVTGRKYMGFNKRTPSGRAIVDFNLPFTVELSHQFPSSSDFQVIRPYNLDKPVAMVLDGHHYRLEVAHKTKGSAVDEVSIEFINSRPYLHYTQNIRIHVNYVFHNVRLEQPDRAQLNVNRAKITVASRSGFQNDGFVIFLDAKNPVPYFDTYLWLRVTVRVGGLKNTHDFGQIGLRHTYLGH